MSANLWIEVDKLAALIDLIEVSALANDWTRVRFSLITMDACMKYITEVCVPPVTGWSKTTVEWNA